jgi:hypothetical protein
MMGDNSAWSVAIADLHGWSTISHLKSIPLFLMKNPPKNEDNREDVKTTLSSTGELEWLT